MAGLIASLSVSVGFYPLQPVIRQNVLCLAFNARSNPAGYPLLRSTSLVLALYLSQST